jgi:hypothetical protein
MKKTLICIVLIRIENNEKQRTLNEELKSRAVSYSCEC